jgi:hypothetical protein
MNYASPATLAVLACPGGGRAKRPRFKTPVRFALFPPGAIKAEILESIRGKDLSIVQDGLFYRVIERLPAENRPS